MKKFVNIIILAVLFVLSAAIAFNLPTQKQKSKIKLEKTVVEEKSKDKYIVHVPMAELPKAEPQKKYDVLEGRITAVPGNLKDPKSRKLIVLRDKDSNLVVLTNIPYVHTIAIEYAEKDVKLSGSWGKKAVIFGKEYKTFWIEDIDLAKSTVKK
jgi:hypothetical protein